MTRWLPALCSFSGGQELARALLPNDDLTAARLHLQQTVEAQRLLDQKNDVPFGGVRDMRAAADKATRLVRLQENFPTLAEIAVNIEPCDEVVAEIGRCINDRGEVVGSASNALAKIRVELRIAQERLLTTLERLVHNSDLKPSLQPTRRPGAAFSLPANSLKSSRRCNGHANCAPC